MATIRDRAGAGRRRRSRAGRLEAVELGHLAIHQDEVVRQPVERGDRLAAVGGDVGACSRAARAETARASGSRRCPRPAGSAAGGVGMPGSADAAGRAAGVSPAASAEGLARRPERRRLDRLGQVTTPAIPRDAAARSPAGRPSGARRASAPDAGSSPPRAARSRPSIAGHLTRRRHEIEGLDVAAPSEPGLGARHRVLVMPHALRWSTRNRRLVALSSTTSTRRPTSVALRRRRAAGRRRADQRAEAGTSSPRPGSLSTLDVAAHQLDEPLADREAEAGAAEPAGGRGVRLAERLEQASEPSGGMPMPVSRDREVQQRRIRVAASSAVDVSTTSPCSVNLTAFPSRLSTSGAGASRSPTTAPARRRSTIGRPARGPSRGARRQQLAAPPRRTSRRSKAIGLQVEPARLDLREVEDVVDDREQRVAAAADRLARTRAARRQRGVEQQPAHADDAFIGVRISWLMLARKSTWPGSPRRPPRARPGAR